MKIKYGLLKEILQSGAAGGFTRESFAPFCSTIKDSDGRYYIVYNIVGVFEQEVDNEELVELKEMSSTSVEDRIWEYMR
jgi:hypothetical protein